MECDHRDKCMFCASGCFKGFDKDYILRVDCECERRKYIECKDCWRMNPDSDVLTPDEIEFAERLCDKVGISPIFRYWRMKE